MTPLRRKITNDLIVRNSAENMQKSYLQAVTGLAGYYHRSPDRISAQEGKKMFGSESPVGSYGR